MAGRTRVKHELTFEERLIQEAERFKLAAEREAPGSTARELLLRRVSQAEQAIHMNRLLSESYAAQDER